MQHSSSLISSRSTTCAWKPVPLLALHPVIKSPPPCSPHFATQTNEYVCIPTLGVGATSSYVVITVHLSNHHTQIPGNFHYSRLLVGYPSLQPVACVAVSRYETEELKLRHSKALELSFPENSLMKEFYVQHPEVCACLQNTMRSQHMYTLLQCGNIVIKLVSCVI